MLASAWLLWSSVQECSQKLIINSILLLPFRTYIHNNGKKKQTYSIIMLSSVKYQKTDKSSKKYTKLDLSFNNVKLDSDNNNLGESNMIKEKVINNS